MGGRVGSKSYATKRGVVANSKLRSGLFRVGGWEEKHPKAGRRCTPVSYLPLFFMR